MDTEKQQNSLRKGSMANLGGKWKQPEKYTSHQEIHPKVNSHGSLPHLVIYPPTKYRFTGFSWTYRSQSPVLDLGICSLTTSLPGNFGKPSWNHNRMSLWLFPCQEDYPVRVFQAEVKVPPHLHALNQNQWQKTVTLPRPDHQESFESDQ